MQTDKETYEPYGDDWVKELMKLPKDFLIKTLLRPALIKQSEVLKSAHPLDAGQLEKIIGDAYSEGRNFEWSEQFGTIPNPHKTRDQYIKQVMEVINKPKT